MAKHAKKAALARLNIYVPDPTIRRQVKAAAAKRDLSVSEYCLQAITNQLVRDRERPSQGKSPPPARGRGRDRTPVPSRGLRRSRVHCWLR